MIIIGAGGFAKEVLEELFILKQDENLCFYDDVNSNLPNLIYNKYPVIKTILEAENFIDLVDKKFTLGVGNPKLRLNFMNKFENIGGIFSSVISSSCKVGHFGTFIGAGCNIMSNSLISNDVKIGKGCIVYFNSVIAHDSIIGDFVELSPGTMILGKCYIGEFSQIGSNTTVLPKVKIGKNVIIGAGSVVTKDIPDNCLAYGVPATIKKKT
jgi:sugar O-acyltransferase (sialic acid O-acetyltransferase NeuD family)